MPLVALPILFGVSNLGAAAIGAGAVLVLVLVVGFFFFFEPLAPRFALGEVSPPSRPVTRGVLVCDWVDVAYLQTVAKQKHVAPEPIRSERGRADAVQTSLAGGIGRALRTALRTENRTDERDYFEHIQDANALLVEVLRALSEEGRLQQDIDQVFGNPVLVGDTLDEMIRAAKNVPGLEAARQAVQTLQATAAKQTKIDHWRYLAQQSRFALVESTWEVTDIGTPDPGEEQELMLRLTKLTQAPLQGGMFHGNPPEVLTTIDMPDEFGLFVRLAKKHLTDQGRARLIDGSSLQAGVFGTTGQFDEAAEELWLTPIAVFARVES